MKYRYIMALLALATALLALLVRREWHLRRTALVALETAETRARTAYAQGSADGLDIGYTRAREQIRHTRESDYQRGYAEAMADLDEAGRLHERESGGGAVARAA
jgi:hypothetical protein